MLIRFVPLLAVLLSALSTELAIRYAVHRQMLDLPGQRRMHDLPTPRGGGIAIVAAAVVSLLLLWPLGLSAAAAASLLLALLLVAAIGWWDDHRPLGALPRLIVQIPAAILVVAAIVGDLAPAGASPPWAVFVAACALVATVWSINLHNFMDGINGLLGVQSAWLFAMLAVLRGPELEHGLGLWPWALAAACAGFVPFNFPRARVFMGDVGSGALGLLVAATILLAARSDLRWLLLGLLLASSFVVDASCTLLSRFLSGRRWYSAHREHLYQWLARSGRSHARVVSYYMAWNFLLVAPLAWGLSRTTRLDLAVAAVLTAYVAGALLWRRAKQAVIAEVRRRA